MEEKPYLYQECFTVSDDECDLSGRLKLSALLRHHQRISTAQLDGYGMDYKTLYREGAVFLLSKLGAHLHRMPASGEEVVAFTSPQGTKGAKFYRQASFSAPDGEVLAEIQTVWFIVDPNTWRTARPSTLLHKMPAVPAAEKIEEGLADERIHPEGAFLTGGSKLVSYSDIDKNRHLNHTVYADLVTDLLPLEKMEENGLARILLHYQNQAVAGDVIRTTLQQGAEGWYYFTGAKDGACCYLAKAKFHGPEKGSL